MSDETNTAPPRQRRSMTWFLTLLTGGLVSGFMSMIAALFLWHVPEGNKEILVYMAGQLSGFTGAAIALWTNTTHESAEKTKLIAKADKVDPHN